MNAAKEAVVTGCTGAIGREIVRLLVETSPSRVVCLTSEAHRNGEVDLETFGTTDDFGFFSSMANTSLARVMFALELAKRLGDEGVYAHAVHPGLVPSGQQRRNMPIPMRAVMWLAERLPLPFKSAPEEAGSTVARLILEEEFTERNGRYFEEFEETEPPEPARSSDERTRLWEHTAEEHGVQWSSAQSPPATA